MNGLITSGTGSRNVFTNLPQTGSPFSLSDRADVLHRQVRDLHQDSASFRRVALLDELEARQQDAAAGDGVYLLSRLSDSGLAWRDVARLTGVTVPAVQKWRRGEGMTGVRRLALAKIVALFDMLGEHFISDPATWLEMPVKDGVTVSRLQLLVEGYYDLVLLLIADDTAPVIEIDRVLDMYDADWRSSLTDDQFESFLASDGAMSIRVARQA